MYYKDPYFMPNIIILFLFNLFCKLLHAVTYTIQIIAHQLNIDANEYNIKIYTIRTKFMALCCNNSKKEAYTTEGL